MIGVIVVLVLVVLVLCAVSTNLSNVAGELRALRHEQHERHVVDVEARVSGQLVAPTDRLYLRRQIPSRDPQPTEETPTA